MKRREWTISERCLVLGDGDISRMADVSDRRGVFDDDSLTRTKLASHEEQATCFQLIVEGWESNSFKFAQRGQVIVILNWHSSP